MRRFGQIGDTGFVCALLLKFSGREQTTAVRHAEILAENGQDGTRRRRCVRGKTGAANDASDGRYNGRRTHRNHHNVACLATDFQSECMGTRGKICRQGEIDLKKTNKAGA